MPHRSLASWEGQGYFVDLYTRRDRAHSQPVVEIAPSVRVAHVDAGPIDEPKRGLADYVPAFVQAVDEFRREHQMSYDLVHSHYWLSGAAARELSAEWGVPHVAMFHTTALTKMLARVGEQEPEPPRRRRRQDHGRRQRRHRLDS